MSADYLFVEKGCPHCAVIIAELDMVAVRDDEFRGTEGQEFFVYSSQSNAASVALLDKFGLAGKAMPVLVVHDGRILTKTKDILRHLVGNGMALKR